ncbi:MAG: hypothetical protein NTV94_12795 [Planctomycetota bacterium]|nr:hypothetical protein [Planctomycetota bacterium]
MRTTLLLLAACLSAPSALAQNCTPTWDYTSGLPGAPSGYVGAMTIYEGDLVASGSFPNMAGAPNTQFLARYNRSSNAWSGFGAGLGSGISNGFGTSFAHYQNNLYVGGFFADAAGLPDTKSIARWDGTAFHSLGTGWRFDSVNAVWTLLTSDAIGGQEKLYIGGGFDNIAGVPAGCIASWDGTTLTPLASTMTLVGINPLVMSMAIFDDGQGGGKQLYIGGRFSAINGTPINMVARWNGSTWSAVGTNLTPRNATAEVDSMLVFNDGTGPALYIGGTNLRVNADGINRATAKWNGLTWSPVGQALTGRTWTLAEFDDGSGKKLYAGGNQTALGCIYRLDGGIWTTLDGGANAQVIRIMPEGSHFYAGGSFVTVNGQTANHLVARNGCVGACQCAADFNQDGGVDGGDVSAFFSDWEAAAGCSDVNQDGGVDGSDINAFFTVWEAGGC